MTNKRISGFFFCLDIFPTAIYINKCKGILLFCGIDLYKDGKILSELNQHLNLFDPVLIRP